MRNRGREEGKQVGEVDSQFLGGGGVGDWVQGFPSRKGGLQRQRG